ncbi:MAG: S8 family serine peptidase, partial [Frankiaceae bacterium]
NRDGNPAGSSGLFAVLWSTASNSVWVDTDQDGSFADQAAMTDYAVHHDMGTFGTDRPATAERDSVPFVVQTDGKDKYVNIGIVSGGHGTHVAGIAAGKDFFGGTFDGAAPEAQIVSIRVCLFISGCTSHALVEGMIFAVKQEHVDVVNLSVGTQFLNDGGSPRAVVYDRLIKQYKAQLVVSAANEGPGVNTVSLASDVIGVGAYVSKATWLADFGVETATADGLLPSSARGPREDGALKPDVVAPGAALSATPAWQPGSPASGAYGLPPGYSVRSGTSMAAPEVTGGAALLISAAKQAGAQYAPDQLRQAISSSARFLPAHGANEQGNGLLQVGAAWNLLRTNAVKTVGITSTAPVRTVASGLLGTPHTGPGIYEREGWTAGQSGARTITFTRTTGGSKAIAYDLSWVGNDGTFSTSAGSISLPVDAPVSLVVHVAPATVGVHSALLRLDDPSTAGIDYETLDTVVAANRLTAANGYAVTQTGSTERGGTASFFFDVPAGTPALKVDLSGTGGQLRMLRFPPYGYSDDSATAPYQAGSQSRTVSDPQAGVWEVTVDTSTGSATAPGTFAVTGSLLGVDIAPAAWVIDGAQTGTAHDRSFAMTNRFGAFTGAEVGTALGSTFADRPAVAAGAGLQLYPIDVPAASTSISARIGNASDPAADLDLYLADCHTGSCVPRAISAGGTANEAVSVSDPAPGRWIVFVDPFAVPSGSTRYDYLDVVASPAFGSVSVDGVPAARAAGATWTVGASVTPLAAPAPGRFLQGFVQVSGGGGILGSAEVDLRSVVP